MFLATHPSLYFRRGEKISFTYYPSSKKLLFTNEKTFISHILTFLPLSYHVDISTQLHILFIIIQGSKKNVEEIKVNLANLL